MTGIDSQPEERPFGDEDKILLGHIEEKVGEVILAKEAVLNSQGALQQRRVELVGLCEEAERTSLHLFMSSAEKNRIQEALGIPKH